MDAIHLALFSVFLGLAVTWDVVERRIPNPLLAVNAVVAVCLAAHSWHGIAASLGGAALGLGLLFVPFALGHIGGGDAKFFAVVGAYLGPVQTLHALVLGVAAGGLVAVPILWGRKHGLLVGRNATVPYALPLALGAVAALFCDRAGISFL